MDIVPELSAVQLRLVETAAILLLLLFARWIILHLVGRRTSEARRRYQWNKAVTYTIGFLALLMIGRVWFAGFRSVATFLGLLAAGLALALKDPIQNLAGWLFLLSRRPFVVGDRIQIGPHQGDVVDQRLFQFTLLEIGNWVDADQSTGRLIHVPNGKVFTEPVANYTRGFPYIWNEVGVTVTFESDWERAKSILLEVARRHGTSFTKEAEQEVLAASRRFLIFYSTLAPAVYTSIREQGVALTIRYICEVRRRRDSAQAISEDVLREFAGAADIAFAYPTTRVFDFAREGKPALRAPES